MGIANRDKDSSETYDTYEFKQSSVVATGLSLAAGVVRTPGQIVQFVVAASGLSGTPTYQPEIHRLTSGGLTVIALGSAVTPPAFGTSGVVGATYAANSSLAAIQVNDLLIVKSGGANSAAVVVAASLVVKKTQEIIRTFSQS